ncbi:hypothetical protein N656DRAFT_572469 [Canariomyces notabilis]|uniref:Uncharacterized protein n=1 Tax=Canariomyces notabilis TaxID=2074819 RepID=A0AAN6TGP2_9PEZI|nr:hypothetical protein N656DRAFT_572469 [Canariomyces arenarius]
MQCRKVQYMNHQNRRLRQPCDSDILFSRKEELRIAQWFCHARSRHTHGQTPSLPYRGRPSDEPHVQPSSSSLTNRPYIFSQLLIGRFSVVQMLVIYKWARYVRLWAHHTNAVRPTSVPQVRNSKKHNSCVCHRQSQPYYFIADFISSSQPSRSVYIALCLFP